MRPEVYCTLSSRSMVTRAESPLAAARIRRTCGISAAPARLADLPSAWTGAFTRASSTADAGAFEFVATPFAAPGASPL